MSMNSELGGFMDQKIKMAINMNRGGANQTGVTWWKSVRESKEIEEIGPVVDFFTRVEQEDEDCTRGSSAECKEGTRSN